MPSTNPLQRGCHKGFAINTIAMPLDQVNGFNMVMFFFGLVVNALPFCSQPCFILVQKVCAKLCFCILCLWMGSSTFQEFVGRKGMFLCFCVSRKQACGHGPSGSGQHTTRAWSTLQLAVHELYYVLQYIVIHTKIDYEQLVLVFLLKFSVALLQNTTGVTTATTMAATGRNGPLAPHMRLCALRRHFK